MRTIGRYVLHAPIASGGMGTVYLGRMAGAAGFARTVAIKSMLSTAAHDEEFVSMFLDEGRLAARVQHPNVVSTLDVVHEGADLILVMEYIHGESLARLTRPRGRDPLKVPAPLAAAIMCDVLDGLHAAHEATDVQGAPLAIVHRDVSPQNVLVGADGVTRVADFGVAKAMGRLHTTRDGDVKGKLAYMAPEQFRGMPVDRRADIFAASIVLWETLTGERLFTAATEGEIVGRVLANDITPPRRLVPTIPPALEEVVMRGLSAEPGERFPTAQAMARALEAAGPVARRAEISDWVNTLAKTSLDGRARLISEIERATADRDSAAARVVAAVASSEHLPLPIEQNPSAPSASEKDAAGSGRTAAPVATLSRTGSTPPTNRAAIAMAVLLASILGTAAVLYVRRPAGGVDAPVASSSAEPSRSAAPMIASAAPSATATVVAPPPPPDGVPPAPSGSALAAAPSAAPRTSAPVRAPHGPPAAVGRPKTAPKVDCSDPCPFDERGVKVCKVECLR